MKATIINCTLKPSPESSNTEIVADQLAAGLTSQHRRGGGEPRRRGAGARGATRRAAAWVIGRAFSDTGATGTRQLAVVSGARTHLTARPPHGGPGDCLSVAP